MGKVAAELRQTIRSLRRSPGFTAVAIVSLGLSLGATTAVFSMINAVAFRPLPYPQPERLVEVSEHHPVEVCEGCGVGTSYPAFLDLRELDVFERSAVSVESTFAWGDRTPEGESVPVYGASVSSDFFGVLGEQPVRGRSFAADDARPGAPPVVVISEQFWRARLGAAEVLGVDFEINGVSHVVVGIVAADFAFPSGARLWVPIRDGAALGGRSERELGFVARLREGISVEAADAAVRRLGEGFQERYPGTNGGWEMHAAPLLDDLAGALLDNYMTLLGGVVFVLLIAAANLASLLVARTISRRPELAVRAALGASRRDLVRPVLLESLVIAIAGGSIGIVLASWTVQAARTTRAVYLPFWTDFSLDLRVTGFAVVAMLATGLALGLPAALRSSGGRIHETLKGRVGTRPGRATGRKALVVAELALTLILIAGAAMMAQNFFDAAFVDMGYETAGVIQADVRPLGVPYEDPARVAQLEDELVERISALPGVVSAAVNRLGILDWPTTTERGVTFEGIPQEVGEAAVSHAFSVSESFFETLAIPVLRGRGFTSVDDAGGAPVAIVSDDLATTLWPRGDALGSRVKLGSAASDAPWRTIVGIVGAVHGSPFSSEPTPRIYVPFGQRPVAPPNDIPLQLQARITGDLESFARSLRATVRELDPDLVVGNIVSLEAYFWDWIWPARFGAMFHGSLALVGIALAILGIYGVIAYSVSRRTREIGVRMALGADQRRTIALIVREGLWLSALGTLLGCVGIVALSATLRATFFGLRSLDPLLVITVATLFFVVALLATYFPARRAARVEPVRALRAE